MNFTYLMKYRKNDFVTFNVTFFPRFFLDIIVFILIIKHSLKFLVFLLLRIIFGAYFSLLLFKPADVCILINNADRKNAKTPTSNRPTRILPMLYLPIYSFLDLLLLSFAKFVTFIFFTVRFFNDFFNIII